ncbi:MAG: hypothetical protein IJC38_07685 [Erysipelotrichaceae bacterium]|nr:hypothetical protein [Erysipelotrichaceae bacterium]
MKKIILALMTLLLSFGITSVPATAEDPELGSWENPITDSIVLRQMDIEGVQTNVIRCQHPEGQPDMSILGGADSIWLYFTDVESNEEYSYEVTQDGLTGRFMIYLNEANSAHFRGNKVLPDGNYSLVVGVFKNGKTTYYKVKENLTDFPGLFKGYPSNLYVSMSEDGLVLGCNGTSDEVNSACNAFLSEIKDSKNAHLEFREYNDNYFSGESLGHTGNLFFDLERFTWIEGQPRLMLLMTEEVLSKMFTVENQKINVRLSQVPGYMGEFIGTLENVTVRGVPGSEQNPLTSCRLERNEDSNHANAFYITCENPQDLVGNQHSTTMRIVNNDTNEMYRGFNLYYARINQDGKMEISNYELESWYIYDDQMNDTFVPAGNYTVYMLKPDETGNEYTWYLLGDDVDLEQIKKPLPTTAYIKSDETDALVVGCDVTENGCSEWLDQFYATAARPSSEVTNEKFDLSRFMIFSNTDSSGSNFPRTDDDITAIIEKVLTGGKTSALKVKDDAFLKYGHKEGNYYFEMKTLGYSHFIVESFDLVIPTKSTENIKITITQDKEYPFDVHMKAENDETYQFLKNVSQIFIKIPGVVDGQNLHIVGQLNCWPAADSETSKMFYSTAPISDSIEEGTFEVEFVCGGYENVVLENVNVVFNYMKHLGDAKFVLASNGIQIYSDDMEFLQIAAGLKETRYPIPEGLFENSLFIQAVGENSGDERIQFIDSDLVEQKIYQNEVTGKSYVLIAGDKLSGYDFDETKAYQMSYQKMCSGYGQVNSNAFQLSNEYFDAMSEGFETRNDEEVLDVLEDQNIHIGKHHRHHDNVKHHGVDIPKFAGAIVERENERGGFSEDNMNYLGADLVEMTVTVDPLAEGKLDNACDQQDVEATDVQFELELTNVYKSGNNVKMEDEITELPVDVEMTFNMPSEELEEGEEYMLLTEHNGVSELIEITVDDATGKGCAKVDKFSPFMVVKVTKTVTPTPTPTPTPDAGGSEPESSAIPEPAPTPSVPNTSDSSNLMNWSMTAMCTLLAAIALTLMKKRQLSK